MYLPGSGVIETWPSFFSLLPSLRIALDSHRPPPRPFIQLRAFWGFKCEVLGASSNCLGTGCLAVGTVTVGSPKWANAHEWGFNIFVITFAVGQLIEHLGTFQNSPHICHKKTPSVLVIFCAISQIIVRIKRNQHFLLEEELHFMVKLPSFYSCTLYAPFTRTARSEKTPACLIRVHC